MAVNVDWDVVESVEDLDKVFKKALARADEADEPSVRAEWSEAKSTFWQRRAETQALAGAKRDALDKYPLAKEFADDIRGNTAAEIEAAAKRFHERMEKVTKDADDAKAAAAKKEEDDKAAAAAGYGAPAGAGGGTPSRPQMQNFEADEKYVMDKLMQGDGLQDPKSKIIQRRWQDDRIKLGFEAAINKPSYRSFSSKSPDDKKITDDRTRRKQA
jgi:hypothetical protein